MFINKKFMKMKTNVLLAAAVAVVAAGCDQSGGDSSGAGGSSTASNPPTIGDYAHAAATNTANAAGLAWANVKESFHSAMGYGFSEKDEFVAKTKDDMADLDHKISDLSARAADAGSNVKAGVQDNLQDLKAKRAVLDQKLTDIKNATAGDWDAAKTNFQNSFYDVKAALQDTWHSIKGN